LGSNFGSKEQRIDPWRGTKMADAENEFVQWRERLKEAHRQMQDAMSELIDKKDYSAAETSLRVADRLMLDLIEDTGGYVVRQSD
jgi:hypothetical protein